MMKNDPKYPNESIIQQQQNDNFNSAKQQEQKETRYDDHEKFY
jgi:hypothetical protein